jgi:hypothetical protein
MREGKGGKAGELEGQYFAIREGGAIPVNRIGAGVVSKIIE